MPFLKCYVGSGKFYGRTYNDIVSTLDHYVQRGQKIEIPSQDQMETVERVELCFVKAPGIINEHYIHVDVSPELRVSVNANAYGLLLKNIENSGLNQRGSLAKIVTSNFDLNYIPQDLANELTRYDWGQYREKMDEFLEDEIRRLNELGKDLDDKAKEEIN